MAITVTGHNSSLHATYYFPVGPETRIVCGSRSLAWWENDKIQFFAEPDGPKPPRDTYWQWVGNNTQSLDELPEGWASTVIQGSVWAPRPQ